MADDTTLRLIEGYEIVLRHLEAVQDEARREVTRANELYYSIKASLDRVREAAEKSEAEPPLE